MSPLHGKHGGKRYTTKSPTYLMEMIIQVHRREISRGKILEERNLASIGGEVVISGDGGFTKVWW